MNVNKDRFHEFLRDNGLVIEKRSKLFCSSWTVCGGGICYGDSFGVVSDERDQI